MKRVSLPLFPFFLGGVFLLAACAGPRAVSGPPIAPAGPSIVYSNVVLAQPAARAVYHTVAPGETLYRIGKTYGVSVDDLMRANRIRDPSKLKQGQTLYIPGVRRADTAAYPSIPLYPDTGRWLYIVVHHTATHEGDKAEIDRIHRNRGFGELGYHFIIDNGTRGKENGQIEVGNRWINQLDGAHAKADNMNHKGIGIALIGNFSEENLSETQLQALVHLVKTLRDHYHIPKWRVIGHRDVSGAATECPGNYFPWKRFQAMLD